MFRQFCKEHKTIKRKKKGVKTRHKGCISFFSCFLLVDNLVKTSNLRWLSKKLHIRGASIFYHFGVLGYVVMIENWYPKSTSCGAHNEGDEEFSPKKRV